MFPFHKGLSSVENYGVFFGACAVVYVDYFGEGGWQGMRFQVRILYFKAWMMEAEI